MATTSISKIAPGEGTRTHPMYSVWEGIIPLPTPALLWSVGGATLENFLVVSEYCPPDATIVDIGCGCGRTCRILINNPHIKRYIGFDVISENVQWCQNFLAPSWKGRAEFHYFDIYSHEYNPEGKSPAGEFTFPCDTGKADVVFAASVFTHLLEHDALHYLTETARVLSARGHAVLSIHTEVVAGENYKGHGSPN